MMHQDTEYYSFYAFCVRIAAKDKIQVIVRLQSAYNIFNWVTS